jgi:hypothetical protein
MKAAFSNEAASTGLMRSERERFGEN